MSWTDQSVETLKTLWLDGLSASQIAKQLGDVTRNAVIGKVHRLGLSFRATPSQPSTSLRSARAVKAITPAAPRKTAVPVLRIPKQQPAPIPAAPLQRQEERGGATLLTLGAHMCKWPIGNPSDEDFSFCGRRSHEERPYCGEHSRLAYQPIAPGVAKATPSALARSLRRYL